MSQSFPETYFRPHTEFMYVQDIDPIMPRKYFQKMISFIDKDDYDNFVLNFDWETSDEVNNILLLDAIKHNAYKIAQFLLFDVVKLTQDDLDYLFLIATYTLPILELLFKVGNLTDYLPLIKTAIVLDSTDVLKYLIEVKKINLSKMNLQEILEEAATEDAINCLSYIITYAKNYNPERLFALAIKNYNSQIAQFLLEKTNLNIDKIYKEIALNIENDDKPYEEDDEGNAYTNKKVIIERNIQRAKGIIDKYQQSKQNTTDEITQMVDIYL